MKVSPSTQISFALNGKPASIACDPTTALLYILRNDFCLNSPKFGCGLGECGACAVLVDGRAVRSCVVPVGNVSGRTVTTLEGLGSRASPGPMQAAFIAEQAAQCGYCMSGMIITAHAFLTETPNATAAQIAEALRHNLCRCGTHIEILRAVVRAAMTLKSARGS